MHPLTPDYSLLAVALLLCIAGIWERFADKRKRREHQQWIDAAVKTEGVVSRLSERKDYSGPSDSYDNIAVQSVPIVRFRAANGHEYEIDGPDGIGEIGTRVAVAYNPNLPSDARTLATGRYRGGCGFILIAIGLILAIKAMMA